MKTYYSEYAAFCLRFYVRYPNPRFRNQIEKENWLVCDSVMRKYDRDDQAILRFVYKEGDTIGDNVYQYARIHGVNQDRIWKLIREVQRKVAIRRGLI